jgi:hypothetical protein
MRGLQKSVFYAGVLYVRRNFSTTAFAGAEAKKGDPNMQKPAQLRAPVNHISEV